jgi:tetratricopeptide (TPR) repeat protein
MLWAAPCPPEAGALVEAGWRAYRADSIAVAADRFARADRMCEGQLDAKIGLAYARLRQDNVAAADSLFLLVTRRDSTNTDAWDGRTLTRWRLGDRAGALAAGRRAIRLNPKNETTRGILAQIDPDWDRQGLRPAARLATLRVDARTHGDFFEVPAAGGGWRRFYVNGVNMGVALPGKFPSEFPPDSATYAGWFSILAGMHANTLRLYTILPPSFYRALRVWNEAHPGQPLWLIHGVWTELPPEHDFDDKQWKGDFRQEMRHVVDLLHGTIEIPRRPGHAGGRYDADVSRWVLGYIIGREWEPFAVEAFEKKFKAKTAAYRGRFLEARSGQHIDAWMAEQCDYLLGYEVDRYNTIRPIAYTNWPTLDPLYHITEATGKEESAWRAKVGRPTPRDPIEYENDALGLDAMAVRATARNPAGWFASYHAYPYYPDFLLYDPGYDTTRSSEGRSNYFGYLTDLKRHHAGVPLLLSEYGVPSSRGLAHLQPQGFHHGGHDESAMARIDARLTREIRESGAAGGIIFAWIDEWFKKNWIVIDYEIPLENTRQWHNVMDAEQNYGILGVYAGDSATTPAPGGAASRWLRLPRLAYPATTVGARTERATLHVGNDESYVYLALELPGLRGTSDPWREREIRIAIDTWRKDLGQRTLPGKLVTGDIGFEFLATFRDTAHAELRIVPGYSPYVGAEVIDSFGDDYGRFGHRPIATVGREDGRFDSLFVITNRARFTRDGRFIGSRGINRGRLRYGREATSTLSDWYWDAEAGLLEVRFPWNLLNVSDPSTATILYEQKGDADIGTVRADGFRFGVVVTGKTVETGAGTIVETLPDLGQDGRWHAEAFPSWQWPTWTVPRYHQRLKPVYDSLKAVWGRE